MYQPAEPGNPAAETARLSAEATAHENATPRLSLLFWGVFGLGAGLRLLGLNKGIWLDEWISLQLVHQQDFLSALRLDDHPPLYYVLLRAALHVQDSEPMARLLSVAFGIATLFTLMVWVRRYSLLAGILAGFIGATAPMLLRFSQELRSYPLLLFATTLAFYSAWQVVVEPQRRRYYVALTIAFVLAVMSQLVAPAVVIMVLVFMLANRPNWRQLRLAWLGAAVLIPTALFLFHYFVFSRHDFTGWWMPPLSIELVGNVVRGLFDTDMYFVVIHWSQATFPALAAPVDLVLKGALLLVLLGLLFGQWRTTAPLAFAAVSYVAIVTLVALFGPHIFWSRTLLPSLTPAIAFVAVQLSTIRLPRLRHVALAGVAATSLVMGATWAVYSAWQPVEPYRQVAELAQSKWQPNSLILVYPSYIEGPIHYSAPRLPQSAFVPLDWDFDPPSTEAAVEQRLAQWPSGQAAGAVFLLSREDAIVEQGGTRYKDLQAELKRRFGEAKEVGSKGLLVWRIYR